MLADRARAYNAAFAASKKAPAKAKSTKALAPKKAIAQPLRILAEGDSWFDYPAHPRGGIISRLALLAGVPILNLAKPGDEVRSMLGVEARKELRTHLRKAVKAGKPWDVLLFSGGGNDIVDDPMALWIRDFKTGASVAQLIHTQRFDAALGLVRAAYEDLITLRDVESPSTLLVFHTYDHALPDGRDVCFFGPWLEPTFKLRGFPSHEKSPIASEVVKAMLQKFAAMLASLATPNVLVLDGQRTLAPVKKSWHNELHPSSDGFDLFAGKFHALLRATFPGRVV